VTRIVARETVNATVCVNRQEGREQQGADQQSGQSTMVCYTVRQHMRKTKLRHTE